MPELKNLFVQGKMNKDLDERLVPQGEYRDANNIDVSYSDGSNVGAIEPITGTVSVGVYTFDLTDAHCVGSVVDTENDKFYGLIYSPAVNLIVEYGTRDTPDARQVVLADTGSVLNFDPTRLITGINILDGILYFTDNYSEPKQVDIEYWKDLNNVSATVASGTAGNTTITLNEDISTKLQSLLDGGDNTVYVYGSGITQHATVTSISGTTLVVSSVSSTSAPGGTLMFSTLYTTPGLSEDRITVIKKSPLSAPTFYSLKDSFLDNKNFQIGDFADLNPALSSLYCNFVAFTGTYIFYDFSEVAVGEQLTLDIFSRNIDPDWDYSVDGFTNYWEYTTHNLDLQTGQNIELTGDNPLGPGGGGIENPEQYKITAYVDSVTLPSAWTGCTDDPRGSITITILERSEYIPPNTTSPTTGLSWNAEIIEDSELLSYYKLKFIKFAYRYKYSNGQYSCISPFSKVAFIPNSFEYDGKKGYNLAMENKVKEIILQGWPTSLTSDNYEADIEEIEILSKESSSTNIYAVDVIKKTENGNTEFPATFEIKNNQIFKALESNQLLRSFDSVPKKAKSQEIVANRLIYGNYAHNFNLNSKLTFDIQRVDRSNSTELLQKLSLKSNRNYQLGVVFLDEYQRQTPVFSDKTGVFELENKFSEKNNQLQVKCSIQNLPGGENISDMFTHYRYFIKEISNEYYNILISNFYFDSEENYYYVSLPVTEINKIDEEDYLIAKKQYKSGAYLGNDLKFKILEKRGTPPDFLAYKEEIQETLYSITFSDKYSDHTADVVDKKAGFSPVPGFNMVLLNNSAKSSLGDGSSSSTTTITEALSEGDRIRFTKIGGDIRTKAYTIKQIQVSDATPSPGNVEIIFEENFGEEINDLYTSTINASLNFVPRLWGIGIEKVNKISDVGNKAYQNKFFLKLASSPGLAKIFNSFVDTSLLKTTASKDLALIEDWNGSDTGSRQIHTGYDTVNDIYGIRPSTSYTGKLLWTIYTSSDYDHADSAYQNDPFLNNLKIDNYLRISATDGSNGGENSAVYRIFKINTYPAAAGHYYYEIITYYDENYPNIDLETYVIPTTSDTRRLDIMELKNEELEHLKDPAIFEVEPKEGVLDIYYDTDETFPISDIASSLVSSTSRDLSYSNCFSFANGVESDRIRDDYNAPMLGKGIKVSAEFKDNYQEETLKSGLIFSQIYNSKNGVNRLNQFIIAEDITKDLNPEYGAIQKLHTRDTDLIALCEDKVLRVLANKDALFNADGNVNVTSNAAVLGQAIPFAGEYGISKNPESFASYTYRAYFTDRNRGKVLRLSLDGLTEISNYGMKDYFKDKFYAYDGFMHGSYDAKKDQYNLSIRAYKSYNLNKSSIDETISYSEDVRGWVSKKDWIQEAGGSINNQYFTFYGGHADFHHNSGSSTLHGSPYKSDITFLLNGNPGNIKNFRTINYHGGSGWEVDSITTDKQSGSIDGATRDPETGFIYKWREKEGIYYNYISGITENTKSNLDLKSLNVQGLGTPTGISGNDAIFADLNNAIQVGDKVFNNSNSTVRTVTAISGNTITLDGAPENTFNFFSKDNKFNTSGVLGYYAEIKMETTNNISSSNRPELYSVGSEVSLSS